MCGSKLQVGSVRTGCTRSAKSVSNAFPVG
jgi:hypothetical protein